MLIYSVETDRLLSDIYQREKAPGSDGEALRLWCGYGLGEKYERRIASELQALQSPEL